MKGHPGTGKSTLARAVAATLRYPLLDKDDVRDPTMPIQLHLINTNTFSSAASTSALLNDLSYAVLWRAAETQLRLGLSVIIDSPLSRRTHLERLISLSSTFAARLAVVECRSSDQAEWRRRLEAREAARDDGGDGWHKPATWAELRRLVDGYEGGSDYEFGSVPRLVVDTTATDAKVEDMVAAIVEFIGTC